MQRRVYEAQSCLKADVLQLAKELGREDRVHQRSLCAQRIIVIPGASEIHRNRRIVDTHSDLVRESVVVERRRKDVTATRSKYPIRLGQGSPRMRHMLHDIARKNEVDGVVLKVRRLHIHMKNAATAFATLEHRVDVLTRDVIPSKMARESLVQSPRRLGIPDDRLAWDVSQASPRAVPPSRFGDIRKKQRHDLSLPVPTPADPTDHMLPEVGIGNPEHRRGSADVAVPREISQLEGHLVASVNGRVNRPEVANHLTSPKDSRSTIRSSRVGMLGAGCSSDVARVSCQDNMRQRTVAAIARQSYRRVSGSISRRPGSVRYRVTTASASSGPPASESANHPPS